MARQQTLLGKRFHHIDCHGITCAIPMHPKNDCPSYRSKCESYAVGYASEITIPDHTALTLTVYDGSTQPSDQQRITFISFRYNKTGRDYVIADLDGFKIDLDRILYAAILIFDLTERDKPVY